MYDLVFIVFLIIEAASEMIRHTPSPPDRQHFQRIKDQLRDLLVATYGDDIAALQRAAIVGAADTACTGADPPF